MKAHSSNGFKNVSGRVQSIRFLCCFVKDHKKLQSAQRVAMRMRRITCTFSSGMIRSTSRENSDTPFQLVTAEELLFDIVPAETEIEASQILSQVLEEAPVKIGKPLIRYDLALDDRVECERATQLQQPSASLGHRLGSHVSQRRWP